MRAASRCGRSPKNRRRPTIPPATVVDRDAADTTAILYTSGTTGRPKGAQLTVGNLLSAGEIGAESSRGNPSDRTGTGLPLFHIFGQGSVMMATFTGGGSLSLLARFDPAAMLDLVRRDKLTIMAGVPTMWNAMLHAAADVDSSDFEQLRIAISGGASLPGEVARAFEARFNCTILEGYGLTETSAFGTFNSIDRVAKIGYTGRAVPRTEVEVRDHDGNVCQAGTVGEVFIKGPTVMKGYWKRPADTAAVLSDDGWFRTGDLGETDADGDLRIVDRVKDLIIRGGYNVYPGEVEEVLYQHPDIIEAAVIGIPDDYYGEEVAAVVAVRPGSDLEADDVTSWARERLSAYKIPRVVQFIDALPKGSTERSSSDRSTEPNSSPRSRTENTGEPRRDFAGVHLSMRSECPAHALRVRRSTRSAGRLRGRRHRLSCGLEMLGRSMGLDRSTVLIQLHELVGIRIRLRADQLIQNRSGLFRAHLLGQVRRLRLRTVRRFRL